MTESMNYIFINVGCLAIVVLLLSLLWRRTRDLWSCGNLFSASFGLAVLGGQVWCLVTESLYAPTPETVLVLYVGWIMFLFGMVAVVRQGNPNSRRAARFIPVDPRIAVPMLVGLILGHLAYTMVIVHATGLAGTLASSESGIVESFATNRLNGSKDISVLHVGWFLEVWHLGFLYYVPLALYLYKQHQVSKKVILSIWTFAGVCSLVNFSRVHFLMLIVFTLTSWVVLFRPSRVKIAYGAGLGIFTTIALFVGMQVVLSHADVSNKTHLSDQVGSYAASSALAFQQLRSGNYHQENPHHAFFIGEGVYYILGKMSLIIPEEYPIGYRAFVYVPHATNVYTFLDSFALDFGIVGIVLGPFIMGMAMAWVCNRVRVLVSYPLLLLYSYFVYTCCIVNLANYLFQQTFLIFLGTVFLLRLLLTIRKQLKPICLQALRPSQLIVPQKIWG